MRSRVMPGSSPTMERRLLVSRLNSVDLPTFGRPTMATSGKFSAPARAGITDRRYVGKMFLRLLTRDWDLAGRFALVPDPRYSVGVERVIYANQRDVHIQCLHSKQ